MSRINLLDPEVSDLIAAGEVIERPASVVKELVENSIDAGATKIRVEIYGGGVKSIKITDNGCGMSADDARKAFLKHATSKISTKADLFNIRTLGFRGEALPSVSAVSRVKLLTKEKGSDEGICLCIEGGKTVSDTVAGCAEGTLIEVKDLFFNTPARLKFLKSEMTETGHITYFIEKLALSEPQISFSYFVNGVQKLFTPGNGNEFQTLFSVYGKEFCDSMLPVSFEDGTIGVNGFTGKPLSSRPNRNYQVFFVNGRVVRSRALQSAFESVYRNSIMIGRYPCCVLMLHIDPSAVDINVHPSKLEIKFSDEKLICDVLCRGIRDALNKDSALAEVEFGKAKKAAAEVLGIPERKATVNVNISPENVPEKKIKEVRTVSGWTVIDYKDAPKAWDQIESFPPVPPVSDKQIPINPVSGEKRESVPEPSLRSGKEDSFRAVPDLFNAGLASPLIPMDYNSSPEQQPRKEETVKEPETKLFDDGSVPDYRITGEAFNTYIIVEIFGTDVNELLFIDKHALHERMNFEKLRTREVEVQTLLAPKLCRIGAVESQIILENRGELLSAGIDVEDFGGEIAVRSIPSLIDIDDVDSVLSEYAVIKKSRDLSAKELFDKFLYSIACKASIKSGNVTSDTEREALVKTYFENREKLKYCPHGRPITFVLTERAIEKQFKRIV